MDIKTFLSSWRCLFLILGCFVCFSGCEKPPEPESEILLRVAGRTVTPAVFRARFEKSLPAGQVLSADQRLDLEKAFLVQTIDRELTLAEAERLGIQVSAADVAAALAEYRQDYPDEAFEKMLQERGTNLAGWQKDLEERMLMEEVMAQALESRLEVTEDEIADYYQEHKKDFNRPAQVRARQIVVAEEAEGQKVLGLLRHGEDFATVAHQYSMSPDAANGGDLGFFGKGEMPPEFDETVFSLPVGRLSDLVQSEYGYHIFLVEEKRRATRLKQAEVTDEIRRKLLVAKEDLAYQEWLLELRSQAQIEINWDLL